MTDVGFAAPRKLRSSKLVRIVLVGGFLGAGKTTALVALADRLRARGMSVGAITNDQAPNLVDTQVVGEHGVPVGEVAGGCFCCRFADLVDAAQAVLDQAPDVLLCEPVGSCTDMAATVLNPLRFFYPEVFRFAPYSVLVDPERVRQAVFGEVADPFPAQVGYILRKQLEEADLIALNKVDTLPAGEDDRIRRALEQRYGKQVLPISAARGDGLDEWLATLLGDGPAGIHLLRDIDYDAYAEGEAVLGWLNAAARIEGRPTFAPNRFARVLMSEFRRGCAARGAEIAHVKVTLSGADSLLRANLTRSDAEPTFSEPVDGPWTRAGLLVNARVQIDPAALDEVARSAVRSAAEEVGAGCDMRGVSAFRPGYPRPPYRFDHIV